MLLLLFLLLSFEPLRLYLWRHCLSDSLLFRGRHLLLFLFIRFLIFEIVCLCTYQISLTLKLLPRSFLGVLLLFWRIFWWLGLLLSLLCLATICILVFNILDLRFFLRRGWLVLFSTFSTSSRGGSLWCFYFWIFCSVHFLLCLLLFILYLLISRGSCGLFRRVFRFFLIIAFTLCIVLFCLLFRWLLFWSWFWSIDLLLLHIHRLVPTPRRFLSLRLDRRGLAIPWLFFGYLWFSRHFEISIDLNYLSNSLSTILFYW